MVIQVQLSVIGYTDMVQVLELLVRSFFSRQKTKIQTVNKTKDSTDEDLHASLPQQYNEDDDDEDDDDNESEAFEEQLAIDFEVQHGDMRSNYIQISSEEHDLNPNSKPLRCCNAEKSSDIT